MMFKWTAEFSIFALDEQNECKTQNTIITATWINLLKIGRLSLAERFNNTLVGCNNWTNFITSEYFRLNHALKRNRNLFSLYQYLFLHSGEQIRKKNLFLRRDRETVNEFL